MPRAFSAHERAVIGDRLLSAARVAFGRSGLRRTSVDELARAAGISKGAFYLFYPSKEALFLAVLQEFEAELRAQLLAEIDAAPDPASAVALLLSRALTLRESEPMIERLALEDAAQLLRALPPEQAEELLNQDVAFGARLLEQLAGAGAELPVAPTVMTGLLRALFFVSLHRDQIGDSVYPAVAELLLEGLTRALVRVEKEA